eukprot:TRINITY_DN9266_c0_g2_i1.p1 TRINITY_DN9266_c0_g2~~TRINITY_DN9266_c0_g2_i1.p1  ORF type:complete len:139 (-),score=24.43 TRINITY_DN9266_c0_g2_i1:62-478(-)
MCIRDRSTWGSTIHQKSRIARPAHIPTHTHTYIHPHTPMSTSDLNNPTLSHEEDLYKAIPLCKETSRASTQISEPTSPLSSVELFRALNKSGDKWKDASVSAFDFLSRFWKQGQPLHQPTHPRSTPFGLCIWLSLIHI